MSLRGAAREAIAGTLPVRAIQGVAIASIAIQAVTTLLVVTVLRDFLTGVGIEWPAGARWATAPVIAISALAACGLVAILPLRAPLKQALVAIAVVMLAEQLVLAAGLLGVMTVFFDLVAHMNPR